MKRARRVRRAQSRSRDGAIPAPGLVLPDLPEDRGELMHVQHVQPENADCRRRISLLGKPGDPPLAVTVPSAPAGLLVTRGTATGMCVVSGGGQVAYVELERVVDRNGQTIAGASARLRIFAREEEFAVYRSGQRKQE